MTTPPVSIVIPSFNGKELLQRYLPDVAASLEAYTGGGEIVVVEDGGNDGTPEWLSDQFPKVKVVIHDINKGFGAAANSGVEAAANDAVILLNNDMSPKKGFIAPLIERLQSSDDVFAVCSKSLVADGTDEAPTCFEDDDGILKLIQPGLEVSSEPFSSAVTVAYAPGGMSVFRRDMFITLGGFDDLYRPFYWEDADLSWRAWKRGFKALYEPRSEVEHLSHGTIGKLYKRDWYDLINHAHRHLFHMRHLEDRLLKRYLQRVNMLESEINLYDRGVLRRAFFTAVARLDEVIERRRADETPARSTEEIIELSSNRPVEKT